MIRTKDRFYWSDALYLARAKNLLVELDQQGDGQIFRCTICSAFVKFSGAENHSGRWMRLKPYEQFLLQKKFGAADRQSKNLVEIKTFQAVRRLYRCSECASHWWLEGKEWNNADDAAVETAE